ncbi:Os05g0193600, partial [Oryza sativa Japonica Group]
LLYRRLLPTPLLPIPLRHVLHGGGATNLAGQIGRHLRLPRSNLPSPPYPIPTQLPFPASRPDPAASDFGAPDIAQGGDGNGKISLSSWAGWLRAR